jgi:hypothetical protein
MSFKAIRSVYNLTFQNYPGLHVKMRSSLLGEIERFNVPDAGTANQLDQFKFFAKKLISWDLMHSDIEPDDNGVIPDVCPNCGLREGELMPTTLQSIRCLEPPFAMAIINGYLAQVAQPDPKVSSAPNSGATPETLRRLAERQNPLK